MKYYLSDAKRLVIKIGSALLVDEETGGIHDKWLSALIEEIAALWKKNIQVLIVSSGAISLGKRELQLKKGRQPLDVKQAAAAVGQIKLAHAYQEVFKPYGITSGQILLTLEDSENRKRYLNAKMTLETLLKLRVIPIINENDTIATAEIRFGDNDRLAARVAQMVDADTLVLLSDINGLYTSDPNVDAYAEFIPVVKKLTPDIMAMAGQAQSQYGSGGMVTKLAAAKIALNSGCKMVIAAGKHLYPLHRIDELDDHTWFIPDITPAKSRKNWIAQHLSPKGRLIIDRGAVLALLAGKSLLLVGVLSVEGSFQKGEAICVYNEDNQIIAKGLSNYSSFAAMQIRGKRSMLYQDILGYDGCEEIIHRNNLVLYTGDNY
jgi:glutamate 5-kinase